MPFMWRLKARPELEELNRVSLDAKAVPKFAANLGPGVRGTIVSEKTGDAGAVDFREHVGSP